MDAISPKSRLLLLLLPLLVVVEAISSVSGSSEKEVPVKADFLGEANGLSGRLCSALLLESSKSKK